jgi:hypothetical protein
MDLLFNTDCNNIYQKKEVKTTVQEERLFLK